MWRNDPDVKVNHYIYEANKLQSHYKRWGYISLILILLSAFVFMAGTKDANFTLVCVFFLVALDAWYLNRRMTAKSKEMEETLPGFSRFYKAFTKHKSVNELRDLL